MIQWISRGAGIQILGILTLNSSCSFSSVAQSCLTLCDPMDCSTPGFPIHHQLLKLAQIHIHQVDDAIQPSHPLSPPSPPTFNLPSIRVFPMSQFFTSGDQVLEYWPCSLPSCNAESPFYMYECLWTLFFSTYLSIFFPHHPN